MFPSSYYKILMGFHSNECGFCNWRSNFCAMYVLIGEREHILEDGAVTTCIHPALCTKAVSIKLIIYTIHVHDNRNYSVLYWGVKIKIS